jgi:hypothetical protein
MDNRAVLIIIAVFLLIPGLLVAALGLSMMTEEPEASDQTDSRTGEEGEEGDDPAATGCMMVFFCSPIFIVPAIALLFLGFKKGKEKKEYGAVSDLLPANETMRMEDIAKTLNVSVERARMETARCIKKGFVKGRIKNDVFYSDFYLKISDKNLKRREFLIDMADILKAYRRISITDFAERIGKDERYAEKIILECLEDGLVKGYISKRSKVFFTSEYLEQLDDVQIGWECPGCGAQNQEILLPGEVDRCPYCGTMSKARATKKRVLAEELEDLEL